MQKYYCKVCADIYDPALGDPDSGIAAGTPFEDLPEDWKCPVCGVTKDQFEPMHQMGEEYTGGEAQEKHVPVISGDDTKTIVHVGSVDHPMEEAHYITKIEIYEGEKVVKKANLGPTDPPEVIFEDLPFKPEYKAIAHCNLHGIWESQIT
ncbi:hypothetical protein HOE67_00380 [Candidatus Peregrinibacteria bacterium]|jgi:desulfoferrodoxin|nr:hypothetical protein [Candidatus Peregrinibacteria bacterium]MBT4055549.1 hypothetical protein [Candidatus Peregrinibacteria bacterium]